jgi:hypothetical protein
MKKKKKGENRGGYAPRRELEGTGCAPLSPEPVTVSNQRALAPGTDTMSGRIPAPSGAAVLSPLLGLGLREADLFQGLTPPG